MSRYNSVKDPLCYPDSDVLRNKADLTEQDELDQFEQLMFLTRSEEDLPVGNLDYAHYRDIHFHFFQDVYEWAGKIREIRTGKGENWFCFPEYIDTYMEKIFTDLAKENYLSNSTDKNHFSERAAHYLSEINAVHPFREGNGRCQLTLLTMLVEHANFKFIEDRLDETNFMNAMIESFSGNNHLLVNCIGDVIE
ncbi:Fic family protein [Kiloniella laminariae]|uniref:protein adenylyltransferase n=1 Tax=Kiloniella laminariae TaxID=454162 RepID=A0ABT4LJ03_9PROT|nr:Fic family protein [Kiloniella laminariae]MCZ4279972.1 Fic family protein [Kiloniella laminariae]